MPPGTYTYVCMRCPCEIVCACVRAKFRRAAARCLQMAEGDDPGAYYGDLTSNDSAGVLAGGGERERTLMCVCEHTGVSGHGWLIDKWCAARGHASACGAGKRRGRGPRGPTAWGRMGRGGRQSRDAQGQGRQELHHAIHTREQPTARPRCQGGERRRHS